MKSIKIPLPGQRILRSMIAVWICVAIYYLRGREGIPFFAVIMSIACIQPYAENMAQAALLRIVGTLVGTVWGAALLYVEYLLRGSRDFEEAGHLLLSGLLVGVILYMMAVLGLGDKAYFAVVVFLSIAMNHALDADPSEYIVNRLIETTIGILVGSTVNSLHLPRVRHPEILFVSGINQVSDAKHHLSPYTKVELNRLIRSGANFTIATRRSPATLFDVTAGVRIACPIIAFNGAVLYDMEHHHYIDCVKMEPSLAAEINAYFKEKNPQHFQMTLEDDLMTIYYHEMVEGTMKERYLKRRRSVYRNYVHTDRDILENVVCYTAMGTKEEMYELVQEILDQPWSSRCRLEYDDYECGEDELLLWIFSAEATRERMLGQLKADLGITKMVKFGDIEEGFDEIIPYHGDRMVKELKRRFETVSLRGWRNMLHL